MVADVHEHLDPVSLHLAEIKTQVLRRLEFREQGRHGAGSFGSERPQPTTAEAVPMMIRGESAGSSHLKTVRSSETEGRATHPTVGTVE